MIKTLTGDPTLVKSGFDLPPNDPFILLKQWLEAADSFQVKEARGFVLSTVDARARPSSRVILIKEMDDTGIIFSTSSESTKGKDLKLNSWASGTLWCRETMQQINIQGRVRVLPDKKSDEIFHERIREAKAVSVLSKQSAPLNDEETLKLEVLNLVQREGEIERPSAWHAYHLAIESIEFWHGSKDRFHKRLHYKLDNGIWSHQRLQP